MDTQAAEIVANAFATGAFGAFGGLAAGTFPYNVAEIGQADSPRIRNQLARYPFVMRGQFATGEGIAMLFPIADICALQTLLERDGKTRTVLDDADFVTLKETADACIGAAYASLMEKAGRPLEPLAKVEALIMDPDQSDELCQFVGEPAKLATVDFKDPGQGARQLLLLFSEQFERLAPEGVTPKASPEGDHELPRPKLSDDEMKDILSGFNAQEDQVVAPTPAPAHVEKVHGKAPANLDMILDIRLAAVARLGRVEMPIGDILTLGPGSIIDVGHLVDEPVELLVNNKLIARGDVVVVDEKFGIRITEIVSTKERIESMR